MTTIRLAVCAALLALTWHPSAPAQGIYPQGWYVGFSGNSPHAGVDWGSGSRSDEGGHGLSLRGGVRLNRRLGIEAAVQKARDLTWTDDGPWHDVNTSFEANALEVSAVATGRFCRIFEGLARGGLAYYDLSGQRTFEDFGNPTTRSEHISDRGLGYLVSFGIAMDPKPKWRFRLEYQLVDFDEDFVSEESAESAFIETITIGMDYRVGRSER
jgi:opacity protein-like surface antigen